MTTAFVHIQSAIVAALVDLTPLESGRVYVNRQRPIAPGIDAAINVRLDQTEAESETTAAVDWRTSYIIECHARAATGDDPAAAVDPLLSDAWARLSALSPVGLGVASVSLRSAINWQYDDAETPTACAVIYMQVQHRTRGATLAAWA